MKDRWNIYKDKAIPYCNQRRCICSAPSFTTGATLEKQPVSGESHEIVGFGFLNYYTCLHIVKYPQHIHLRHFSQLSINTFSLACLNTLKAQTFIDFKCKYDIRTSVQICHRKYTQFYQKCPRNVVSVKDEPRCGEEQLCYISIVFSFVVNISP